MSHRSLRRSEQQHANFEAAGMNQYFTHPVIADSYPPVEMKRATATPVLNLIGNPG
jgi:hypothetical protein